MNVSQQLQLMLRVIPIEFLNTLYMVVLSTLCASLIALPLGIILTFTDNQGLRPAPLLNRLLGGGVNVVRSTPFAILIVTIFPFTRLLVGTSIGTTASIVPLTLVAAAFMARVIESSLNGVDRSVVEAALVMGSTETQIVRKVLLPEALPSIIEGITLTVVNLIGYSAMAGLVGGGGLGKVAIQYGYQRFNGLLMGVTLLLLLGIVWFVQWLGTRLSKAVLHRRGRK
jgi:D-methionine transport system permease protein